VGITNWQLTIDPSRKLPGCLILRPTYFILTSKSPLDLCGFQLCGFIGEGSWKKSHDVISDISRLPIIKLPIKGEPSHTGGRGRRRGTLGFRLRHRRAGRGGGGGPRCLWDGGGGIPLDGGGPLGGGLGGRLQAAGGPSLFPIVSRSSPSAIL